MNKSISARRRSLLYALVVSDFKIRYQGSLLGYLWSLVRPLSLFAVLYVVFTSVFKVGAEIPHFAVYLLLGVMMWNFFVEATNNGLSALVDRGDMIRKVYTPKYAIVLAAVFSAAVNLIINMMVVVVFAIFNGVEFSITRLPLTIFPLLELVMLAVAISFILSLLYVKFRDVKYIWELLLQIGFYVTPVLYPLSRIPEKYHLFMLMNPVAQVLQDARYAMVYDKTTTALGSMSVYAFVPYLIVICLTIISVVYFKYGDKLVAEEL